MKKTTQLLILLAFSFIDLWGQNSFSVRDKFGRDLTNESIRLIDFEGYMANPAMELTIVPGDGVTLPFDIDLSANGARLYFDMPSVGSENGPTKSITIGSNEGTTFFISIFPDRDGDDENYTLSLSGSTAPSQEIPITVVDFDIPGRALEFNIPVDFAQDATDFTDDATVREVVTQAANDWAYFLADVNFDQVPVGEETSFIWTDNFAMANPVTNTSAYSGFLLYVHGFNHDDHRSGGGGSNHAFQSVSGVELPLRRSGTYSLEINGNFNTLGWDLDLSDDQWFIAQNLGNQMNDLYSIALHEIGHTLAFHSANVYTNFTTFKNQGFVDNEAIVEYMGQTQAIDNSDHFHTTVDRLSKRGSFGNEYANEIPLARWLITKFNLLSLQAVGHELRSTSCFEALSITQGGSTSVTGETGMEFSHSLTALGGVPWYNWTITDGTLPLGLELNPFEGIISGSPLEGGNFEITLQLEDYDNATITTSLTLDISGEMITGIIDLDHSEEIRVYPNPASQQLFIESNGSPFPIRKITLLSAAGLEVKKLTWNTANQSMLIDITELHPGMYFILLEGDENTYFKRILKL